MKLQKNLGGNNNLKFGIAGFSMRRLAILLVVMATVAGVAMRVPKLNGYADGESEGAAGEETGKSAEAGAGADAGIGDGTSEGGAENGNVGETSGEGETSSEGGDATEGDGAETGDNAETGGGAETGGAETENGETGNGTDDKTDEEMGGNTEGGDDNTDEEGKNDENNDNNGDENGEGGENGADDENKKEDENQNDENKDDEEAGDTNEDDGGKGQMDDLLKPNDNSGVSGTDNNTAETTKPGTTNNTPTQPNNNSEAEEAPEAVTEEVGNPFAAIAEMMTSGEETGGVILAVDSWLGSIVGDVAMVTEEDDAAVLATQVEEALAENEADGETMVLKYEPSGDNKNGMTNGAKILVTAAGVGFVGGTTWIFTKYRKNVRKSRKKGLQF